MQTQKCPLTPWRWVGSMILRCLPPGRLLLWLPSRLCHKTRQGSLCFRIMMPLAELQPPGPKWVSKLLLHQSTRVTLPVSQVVLPMRSSPTGPRYHRSTTLFMRRQGNARDLLECAARPPWVLACVMCVSLAADSLRQGIGTQAPVNVVRAMASHKHWAYSG